jgi:DNA-binding transcriptional regulator YiaG
MQQDTVSFRGSTSDGIEKGASSGASGDLRGKVTCFGNHRREKTMLEAQLPNPSQDVVAREPSFANCLRHLRQRLVLKQTCLSWSIGCSEAAISLWEAGHRLPTLRNLHRLLKAIDAHGATAAEQLSLRQAWFRDKAGAQLRQGSVVADAEPLPTAVGYGV